MPVFWVWSTEGRVDNENYDAKTQKGSNSICDIKM